MGPTPEVSIIIPTFNRQKLIVRTLNSVQNQTFKNWECIIVDDDSTDNSQEVIGGFIADDSRFKYLKRNKKYPKGAAGCRNFGFEISIGKYIQWLDDDDLLSPNKLELQVKDFETYNSERIVSTCDWDLLWPEKLFEPKNFLENKRELASHFFFQEIRRQQTFVPAHAYLIPRTLAQIAGRWNTRLFLNDDAEYFTRIIINAQKIINTKGCHVLYREHGGERISRKNDKKNLESLLLSYELIHFQLETHSIQGKAFLRWKLMKVFHKYWSRHADTLRRHSQLFKKNEINLRLARYYRIKHNIYRVLFPLYKKIRN